MRSSCQGFKHSDWGASRPQQTRESPRQFLGPRESRSVPTYAREVDGPPRCCGRIRELLLLHAGIKHARLNASSGPRKPHISTPASCLASSLLKVIEKIDEALEIPARTPQR